MPKRIISARLSEEMVKAVDQVARESKVNRTTVIVRAIVAYVCDSKPGEKP